jgi:segregation and condensation protein A
MDLLVPALVVKMECYEGPLAVMITLIKKNKVSIWDIPLAVITDRFLKYVELVSNMSLRIAEDFIEMASLLIFIKSKMLLPEITAHEGEDDPREELIDRIIDYEKVRGMVEKIDSLSMFDRDTFGRGIKTIDGQTDYDLLDLCNIFLEILKNNEERFITIREIKPTLEEKLQMLKTILDSAGLFVWSINDPFEQADKVATMLGMLELTKIKMATISQRKPFGKIVLKRRDN